MDDKDDVKVPEQESPQSEEDIQNNQTPSEEPSNKPSDDSESANEVKSKAETSGEEPVMDDPGDQDSGVPQDNNDSDAPSEADSSGEIDGEKEASPGDDNPPPEQADESGLLRQEDVLGDKDNEDAESPSEEVSDSGAEVEEAPAQATDDDSAAEAEKDDSGDSDNDDFQGSGGLLSQEDIDNAILNVGGKVEPSFSESEDSASADDGGTMSQEDIDAAVNAAVEGVDMDSGGGLEETEQPTVGKADFQQLSDPIDNSRPRNIDLLMDVELPISIELGKTRMNVSDILALGPGSVVELDKLVGEPVDLLVNNKCVARGEVVVVEENFGLRITQLVSPEERIKNLK